MLDTLKLAYELARFLAIAAWVEMATAVAQRIDRWVNHVCEPGKGHHPCGRCCKVASAVSRLWSRIPGAGWDPVLQVPTNSSPCGCGEKGE